jgi:hypothetical protein
VREKYIWDSEQQKLIPYEERQRGALHYVQDDTMPETWHPCDGQHYTSKSEFRRVTRAHGGIECGGENLKKHAEKNRFQFDRTDRCRDIYNSIQQLRRRRA